MSYNEFVKLRNEIVSKYLKINYELLEDSISEEDAILFYNSLIDIKESLNAKKYNDKDIMNTLFYGNDKDFNSERIIAYKLMGKGFRVALKRKLDGIKNE